MQSVSKQQKTISCLNFRDEAWWFFFSKSFRTIVFVLFFFFSQYFDRSILRISSGAPCLSGHRNDSTWEIIFKIWLLIKQGVQELCRSFANKDIIVFHAYPRSITRSFMRWFLSVRVFGLLSSSLLLFFFSNIFNYRFLYCIHLYTWSIQLIIAAHHICRFLNESNRPKFSSINYFNFIPLEQMVSLLLPYMVRHTRLFNLTSYYCLTMFF